LPEAERGERIVFAFRNAKWKTVKQQQSNTSFHFKKEKNQQIKQI
jgi:hypothetical protein